MSILILHFLEVEFRGSLCDYLVKASNKPFPCRKYVAGQMSPWQCQELCANLFFGHWQKSITGVRCEISFSKMIPNILAGEGTNFCVFSRYLSLLERGLLQETHFATDPYFAKMASTSSTLFAQATFLFPLSGAVQGSPNWMPQWKNSFSRTLQGWKKGEQTTSPKGRMTAIMLLLCIVAQAGDGKEAGLAVRLPCPNIL